MEEKTRWEVWEEKGKVTDSGGNWLVEWGWEEYPARHEEQSERE